MRTSVNCLCLCSALLLAGLVGCQSAELNDESFGIIDLAPFYTDGATPSNPAGGLPRELTPVRGFLAGETAEFYDFGLVPFERAGSTPTVAPVNPMFFFFDQSGNPMFSVPVREERTGVWTMPGGAPTLSPNQAPNANRELPYSIRARKQVMDPRRKTTAHQRPIIDVGPEALATRYTGLWEIIEVTPPAGYTPDSIKSWKTLEAAFLEGTVALRRTGKVINCPLVDERTTVVPSVAGADIVRPKVELWYRRKKGTCFLVNGWETLAKDGQLIAANEDEARLDTFDVRRVTLTVGTEQQPTVLVPVGRFFVPTLTVAHPDPTQTGADFRYPGNNIIDERPRRTLADPPGYTPMRWQWDVMVPPEPKYQIGDMRSAAPVDEKSKRARSGGPWVRNLALAGSLLGCGTKVDGVCSAADACGAVGLECNHDTCLCDAPTVGYGRVCAPGFQRCRGFPMGEEEKRFAPEGYVCHPREPRGFCLPRCDANKANTTMTKGPNGETLDSRCGNLPGFTCVTPGVTTSRRDDKKLSVCVRACDSEMAPERSEKLCRDPLRMAMPLDDGSVAEMDVAQGLKCYSQRSVSGCNFDDALEPR